MKTPNELRVGLGMVIANAVGWGRGTSRGNGEMNEDVPCGIFYLHT